MGKPRRFARFFAAFAPKEKEQGRLCPPARFAHAALRCKPSAQKDIITAHHRPAGRITEVEHGQLF